MGTAPQLSADWQQGLISYIEVCFSACNNVYHMITMATGQGFAVYNIILLIGIHCFFHDEYLTHVPNDTQ